MTKDKPERKCIKVDKLGECIEWAEVGGEFVAKFNEDLRKCNPDLFAEWKTACKEKRINIISPHDE